jgi:NAD(P)-dependent dehydrogenase (short-subunit alcohol dehydrogenase family)
MTTKPLAGLVALVTGGGSGIGRATAQALAAAGADVGIVDLAPGPAQAVADGIAAEHGVRTAVAEADVADEDAARAAHGRIAEALGPVTVLVNNAGIMAQEVRPFHEQPIAHFDRMLAIHLRGSALFSALAVPGMRQAGFGRIVNLSSVLGHVGLPYRAGYSVAKTAINGLTRALAMENARYGITVNAIAPGYIATETNLERGRLGLLNYDLYAERTPVGRWGRPDEIARVITFLADPASAFITGAIIPIDGGYTARGDPGEDIGPRAG